jgi:hypothetical protein
MTPETSALPLLLKCPEVALLLRTTVEAVYAMKARNQLPGVVTVGRRRFLVRRDDLLRSIEKGSVSSLGGHQR